MDRKAIAKETLSIMEQGYYYKENQKIEISQVHEKSVKASSTILPEESQQWLNKEFADKEKKPFYSVRNCGAVELIKELSEKKKEKIGVLNFASAKNPGGGFLNGAMAQEESLAASSGLYGTQIVNRQYYEKNRACGTMVYTSCAIYSPDVVFFRDGRFALVEKPFTASVLTLPAVNYGQVLLKKENAHNAKEKMKERMKTALAIFAHKGDKILVLGAYGCGVFRNDPYDVAKWWKELLVEEGWEKAFDELYFAVLDKSKTGSCIHAFAEKF